MATKSLRRSTRWGLGEPSRQLRADVRRRRADAGQSDRVAEQPRRAAR